MVKQLAESLLVTTGVIVHCVCSNSQEVVKVPGTEDAEQLDVKKAHTT
jgi:hypothetical protein